MRPWRCRRACSVQERALAALADLALDSLPAGASLSKAERLRPAVGEGGARKEVEQGAGGVSITCEMLGVFRMPKPPLLRATSFCNVGVGVSTEPGVVFISFYFFFKVHIYVLAMQKGTMEVPWWVH